MIAISSRGLAFPASPIRKLVPYAEKAKAEGTHIYHLNIGQPDILTPLPIRQAIQKADIKILEYTHSAGLESYRKKLAHYYQQKNILVDENEIIITTGGSEAILFAMLTCMNVGDEIIVPEPFYANYNAFAVAAGVKIVPIVSSIETGFALPPISSFEAKITPKTKAILLSNPNNPTGYNYTIEELEALKKIVLEHQLFIFSDEAYSDFLYSGSFISAMQLKGIEENVVLIDTISKRYSACGARIGALISKNKTVIEAVLKLAQMRLCAPYLEQIAAEAALDLPPDYFQETKAIYQARRDFLVKRLNRMPGVFCPCPNGAFYVMARLPIDDSDKFCQWLLESFSYNDQTVMLAPATGFYSNPELGKKEVRIAYVLNEADLRAAMNCLAMALRHYPDNTLVAQDFLSHTPKTN